MLQTSFGGIGRIQKLSSSLTISHPSLTSLLARVIMLLQYKLLYDSSQCLITENCFSLTCVMHFMKFRHKPQQFRPCFVSTSALHVKSVWEISPQATTPQSIIIAVPSTITEIIVRGLFPERMCPEPYTSVMTLILNKMDRRSTNCALECMVVKLMSMSLKSSFLT